LLQVFRVKLRVLNAVRSRAFGRSEQEKPSSPDKPFFQKTFREFPVGAGILPETEEIFRYRAAESAYREVLELEVPLLSAQAAVRI